MLYALLVITDGQEGETVLGIFTRAAGLKEYVENNVPPEGRAYSVAEFMADVPGIRRQIDLAIMKEAAVPAPSMVTENPMEAVFEAPPGSEFVRNGLVEQVPVRPKPKPFDVRFLNADGRELVRIFETSHGILDAQFRPEDLTEGCTVAVHELMRLFKTAEGIS